MNASIFRNPAAVLLGIWALSLSLGIGPRPVRCHKADGRVFVETESARSECRCEKCRRDGDSEARNAPDRGGGPTLRSRHCAHEPIPADASFLSGQEGRDLSTALIASVPVTGIVGAGAMRPSFVWALFETPLRKPPPAALPVLRC